MSVCVCLCVSGCVCVKAGCSEESEPGRLGKMVLVKALGSGNDKQYDCTCKANANLCCTDVQNNDEWVGWCAPVPGSKHTAHEAIGIACVCM